jgi:hypothetical protein
VVIFQGFLQKFSLLLIFLNFWKMADFQGFGAIVVSFICGLAFQEFFGNF